MGGLLASASLPSYRGAGCRGFSIRIGMCHRRPHPLRWGFRDPYGASWPRAMCPRGTRGDTDAGPAGLDRALGATECAVRVPLAAVEWHSILRQLYVCRLPRHPAPPSAKSACHSPPSSGAREAARLEGHQRDGRHRIARGSGLSGGRRHRMAVWRPQVPHAPRFPTRSVVARDCAGQGRPQGCVRRRRPRAFGPPVESNHRA